MVTPVDHFACPDPPSREDEMKDSMKDDNDKYSYKALMDGADEPRSEMTRGQQTAWIVGAILLVGIVLGSIYRSNTWTDPCENFFGIEDTKCAADRATAILMRGGY
jgi:hypothetical protein